MALDYLYASSALLSSRIETLRLEFQESILNQYNNGTIENIQINFETYLKSQIHYNVVLRNNNSRRIVEYNNAYNFMINNGDDIVSYKKVLNYYYNDISELIFSLDLNQLPDFSLIGKQVIPRCEEIGFKEISSEKILSNLQLVKENQIVREDGIDYVKVASCTPIVEGALNHPILIAEGSLLKYLSSINTNLNIIWR